MINTSTRSVMVFCEFSSNNNNNNNIEDIEIILVVRKMCDDYQNIMYISLHTYNDTNVLYLYYHFDGWKFDNKLND